MPCEKCGYQDEKKTEKFEIPLCSICNHFAPDEKSHFDSYISEKLDWKILDSFRKYNQSVGQNDEREGFPS